MTGADLKSVRQQLGLTQAGLARALDIPVNTIARWERGEVPIRHARVLRLALERLLSDHA